MTARAAALSTLLFLSSLFTAPARAADPNRVPWALDPVYSGPHQNEFNQLRRRVPVILRDTAISVAVKLGLDFREGWRYPLTVRFADSLGGRSESQLANVVLYRIDGEIRQDLNVNLAAYAEAPSDFDKLFAHEIVHAMLNDAGGAEAAVVLPTWFNEGLAVYGSGQGERLVQAYTAHFGAGFAKRTIMNGLESPHGAVDYAEDYLAFRYIEDRHGPNAVPLFVRQALSRGGDVKAAYEYATGEDYDRFLENARAYGERYIEDLGPATRGSERRPY